MAATQAADTGQGGIQIVVDEAAVVVCVMDGVTRPKGGWRAETDRQTYR